MKIDLNSDMGEGFGPWKLGDDAAMLDIITSANVACGYHAGDPMIMHDVAKLAKQKGVAVGAHPGFNDLWGFGRRIISGDSPSDLEKLVAYQIGAFIGMASLAGHKVTHVKTHGALGNLANDEEEIALAIGRAIKGVDRSLVYVAMPGLPTERAAQKLGLAYALEVFADRTYDDNGTLTSRKKPGSVLHDAEAAAERVLRMVEEQAITTVTGRKLKGRIDTICVHGDNPAAVAMARTVREKLEANGITLAPFA